MHTNNEFDGGRRVQIRECQINGSVLTSMLNSSTLFPLHARGWERIGVYSVRHDELLCRILAFP
jgi:hypothetical protein